MTPGAAQDDSWLGVLLTVAYEGSLFHGLARQRGARTVAGEIDAAVSAIDPGASPVRAVSRTDAGVHARAQMMAFDTQVRIPSRGWALGLTRLLPPAIAIVRAARVDAGFDPRAEVVSKTYRYLLHVAKVRDPFLHGRAWHIRETLELDRMYSEAQALVGEHDYAAFRGAADGRSNTRCRLIRLDIRPNRTNHRLVDVEIEGDRFLYKMVRIIVGSLVDVARGRLDAGALKRALASGSRADLGITAPPDGLYLDSVALKQMGQDPWPNPSSD